MIKIPTNVLAFSGEANLGVYKMFHDYFNHYRAQNGKANVEFETEKSDGTKVSFAEKEELMNAALRKEIFRVAQVGDMSGLAVEQWITHPSISWATFAVVSAMIDMVLAETVVDSIGMYTDVKSIGLGDSASFEVTPRDLFVVSKSGKNQRTAEMHKQFNGLVTIVPEMRQISVEVALFKVLIGMESLAAFVMKAIRSMETALSLDVYGVFAAAMTALPNTADTGLRVAGYTQSALTSMCQRVTGWNNGSKAIIMGTPLALANILPADANYRYDVESSYVKIGYIPTAFGYDIVALPQVMDFATPWGTAIADDRLWVISPSAQKLVKLVLGGPSLSNTTGTFQNANLSQSATIWKSWGAAIATNATAGVITL